MKILRKVTKFSKVRVRANNPTVDVVGGRHKLDEMWKECKEIETA